MAQTRLLIVDDHAIVRKVISMFLSSDPSIEIIGEAEDGREAVRLAKNLRPNVVLMDLIMSGGDGMTAISELKA